MTRTERTYYVVFGLYSTWAWFVAPFYPLFLASRGLDPLEVNLVLATYLIVICFFEVPTGALADRLGRKKSFVLSCLVRTVGFALYATAQNFFDCAIAEVIDGVGTTLATGALDAWAVDGMRADGDDRPVDRFFARAQMLMRFVMIVGGLVCAQVAAFSYAAPWWIAAAGFAATAGVAAWLMHEPPRELQASERVSFLRTMREGIAAVRGVSVLQLVCVLTAAAYFASVPAHMLWQARMMELSGIGVGFVGLVWVAANLAAIAGSALLPRVLARFRRERVLCAAVGWRAFALGLAAVATTFEPTLAGWLMQEVGYGLSEPVLQSWMNEHVPAARRATVLSIRSMAGTLGGGAGLAAIGLVARDAGTPAAWAVSAALYALTAPAYLLLGRLSTTRTAAVAELTPAPPPDARSPGGSLAR